MRPSKSQPVAIHPCSPIPLSAVPENLCQQPANPPPTPTTPQVTHNLNERTSDGGVPAVHQRERSEVESVRLGRAYGSPEWAIERGQYGLEEPGRDVTPELDPLVVKSQE